MIIPMLKGFNSDNMLNEDDDIWTKEEINIKAINYISKYLKPTKSWSDEIKLFGLQDGTCIEFYNYNDDTIEIRCRLDLRELTRRLLRKILGFIRLLYGGIYYNNNAYQVDEGLILELIRKSDRAKFCVNPSKFLHDLQGDLS